MMRLTPAEGTFTRFSQVFWPTQFLALRNKETKKAVHTPAEGNCYFFFSYGFCFCWFQYQKPATISRIASSNKIQLEPMRCDQTCNDTR